MVRGHVCNEGRELELLFEYPAQDWHIFLHKIAVEPTLGSDRCVRYNKSKSIRLIFDDTVTLKKSEQ